MLYALFRQVVVGGSIVDTVVAVYEDSIQVSRTKFSVFVRLIICRVIRGNLTFGSPLSAAMRAAAAVAASVASQ